ncbi:MAG: hybrid sensor histidine kinase/response regulator, partial [Mesorhizobium sp.]
MFAESGNARQRPADTGGEEKPAAPARARITPPPLVPDLAGGRGEWPDFLVFGSFAMLAGLSHLTGAPPFIAVGLLAAGAAGLA